MKTHRCTGILAALAFLHLAAASAHAQSDSARDARSALRIATSASLLVTATLGTLTAINQPTLFSEGRCAEGHPLLGSYGCTGLSALHGMSALLSIVLYTATTSLEFAEFDWPGHGHGAGFAALSYIHLVGMALQPIGGLLAAVPELVGASPNSDFARVLRTIHLVTGYTIVTSFLITTGFVL